MSHSQKLLGLTILSMMTLSALPALAQNNPSRRFDFDKPFTLSAQALNMNLSWRRLEFEEDKKTWSLKRDESRLAQCDTKIEILGRDLATSNPALGEHYYGRMEFNCKSAGSSWKPFRTRFERVLFLGVRNCVESETTIDSDYCELSVVAFRRHADMSQEQGDLSRNTAERREEYGLAGAQHATSVVNRFNLIPQGLARETLNSVQFFRLMINQKGNEFFVPGDSRASGFHVQNHVFKVDPATFANDGKLQDQIQENLNALESIVSRFEASGPNTEDQIKAIADFVSLYNQTARSILQVVSPAQFYKLDRQLAELQAVLSESIKQQSTVSNSASLTRRLQDYERISAFLRERSSTQLQYNLTINLRDLPRKAEPVPERVYPSLDSVLGKSFPYGPILPFGNAADGKLTGLSVKVLDSERGDSSYYYDVVIVDLNNVAQTRELQPNSRLGATDYAFVETLRQLKLPEGVYTAESTARAVSLQECRLWITVNVKSEDRRRVACQVSSWSSDEGWMAEATIVSRGADSALNTSVEKPE